MMEYQNGLMAIHPKFNKLITELRTAVENEVSLDKEATSHDDLFDSFRLSVQLWHLHIYHHSIVCFFYD
jgi:hypothetical protein